LLNVSAWAKSPTDKLFYIRRKRLGRTNAVK